MKIRERPIEVRTDSAGMPISIEGARLDVVRVVEQWTDIGCWWEGEREKSFFRVETSGGALLELYREGDRWVLYRVYD